MLKRRLLEIEIAGRHYRSCHLSAADQWLLLNKLQPVLSTFYAIDASAGTNTPAQEALAAMAPLQALPDAAISEAFDAVIGAVEQAEDATWIEPANDLPLVALTALLRMVVLDNFAAYFAVKRPDFQPIDRDGATFVPVAMPDGDDWLWRPVIRKRCLAESLFNGELRIEHIARINVALDVADENEIRAQKAAEAAARRN